MDDDDDEDHARKRKVMAMWKRLMWKDFSVAEWKLKTRMDERRQVHTWQRGIEYAIHQAQLTSITEEAYGIISHEVQEDEPHRPEDVDNDCTLQKIAREAYAEAQAEVEEAAVRNDPRAWLTGVEGGSASNASPSGAGAQRKRKTYDVEIMGDDERFYPVRNLRVGQASDLQLYRPDTTLKQENGLQYMPNVCIRGSCAYCSAEQTGQLITYTCMNLDCVCVINCCEECCVKMRDLSAQVVQPADDDVTTAEHRKNPFGARKNECLQCKSRTLEMMSTSLSVKAQVLKPLKTNDGLRIGFRCHTCLQYAVDGRLLVAMNSNHICGGVHVVCDTCCKEKYDPQHVQQICCNVPACKRSSRLTTVRFQEGIVSSYSRFTIDDDQPIAQPVGTAAGQP